MTISKDLAVHCQHQIHQIIVDTLDTFRHARVGKYEAATILVGVLTVEAASGANAAGITKSDYMDACGTAFDLAAELYKDVKRARRRT